MNTTSHVTSGDEFLGV